MGRPQIRVSTAAEAALFEKLERIIRGDAAILRYASTTHAVGVRLMPDDGLDICAPFGLRDIFDMVIRPNHVLPNRTTHEAKAARARAIWPQLRIIPWDR